MSLSELLSQLNSAGVRLWVENGSLHYAAPKPGLSAAQREQLAARKDEICRLIESVATSRVPTVAERRRSDDIPLSFEQERLWILYQIDPTNPAYNICAQVTLRGCLDFHGLNQALDEIVRRHEVLRMVVAGQPFDPRSAVLPQLSVPIGWLDIAGLPEPLRRALPTRLGDAEMVRPFDLRIGPLLRAFLLNCGGSEYIFSLTLHHIVFDHLSLAVLTRELLALYPSYAGGSRSPLPDLPLQFSDVAILQRRRVDGGLLRPHLEYWLKQLLDAPRFLQLPFDRPRSQQAAALCGQETITLDAGVVSTQTSSARSQGTTLPVLLTTAFAVVLGRLSGQAEICLGMPVANRAEEAYQSLIGFFVNTVVLRCDLSGEVDGATLLRRMHAVWHDALAHGELPLQMVLAELKAHGAAVQQPLFQVMIDFRTEAGESLNLPNLTITRRERPARAPKFDLLLFLKEAPDGVTGVLEYDGGLFDAATVRRILSHFRSVLCALAAAPGEKVARLAFAAAPRPKMHSEWTCPDADGLGAGIPELFARQAAAIPDAIALRFNHPGGDPAAMTYRQLAHRANRLARRLVARGATAETRIGVLLDASPARPIALLAIMMAGACYVALDARWPDERLALVLDNAAAAMVIADTQHVRRFDPTARPVVSVDDADRDGDAGTGRLLGPDPRNIAYVLFTSGSTGAPKGVAIEQRNVAAFLRSARTAFSIEERAEVLAATPLCFDLSVFELFLPLVWGTTAVLADSVLELHAVAERSALTLVNTVPSVIEEVLRAGVLPKSVVTVNLAGEPLHRPTVDALYALGSVRRVLNLYAPAETTTYSSATTLSPGDVSMPSIGVPIGGTRIDVVDARGEAVPVGVQGELTISGTGVARGYLGQPALTAGSFRPDPLAESFGGRRYHTGDIGRMASDGSLRFLGRRDRQIKLRGYRIELPEIEASIRSHGGVRSATVMLRTTPGAVAPALVAHVVADEDAGCTAVGLREYLGARLPEYMVPASIVLVGDLAHTLTGKVDHLALAATVAPSAAHGVAETATEQRLLDIWREILGRDDINVEHPFFEAGGTSLLLLRLATLVRERLGANLPVIAFLHHPSIRGLARYLDAGEADAATPQFGAAARHRIGRRIDVLQAKASSQRVGSHG